MFGPLQSHGLQHTRLPCLSLSPRVCSNSCPSWVVMPSNHLILCRPLLLLPLVFLSIRVFSNESALDIKWPKYQSFNISISPSNGYSGLISFRIYWFDLLSVQGTLKTLKSQESSPTLQFKSINSLMPKLLYGPILTLVHGYWKNHSFGYTELGWQSDVSAF